MQALEHRHRRSQRWKGRCSSDNDFPDVWRSQLGTDSPWRDDGSITQGTYATAEVALAEHEETVENNRAAITK
jgi:hypothetical protein